MESLNLLVQASSATLLTIAAVLVLVPFERMWPRLALNRRWSGRRRAILAVALATTVLVLVFQQNIQTGLIRAMVPLQITSIAKWPVPDWLVIVLSFVLLDFLNYLMHNISHRLPVLWRLHSVHHADKHVTALTGLLHHPLEFIPVAIFVLFFAVVLGVPVLLYVFYGFAAALHNAFSHSEIALPVKLDKALRNFIITPDMHRTHHSVVVAEGNSNFGTILSIWDRMFGTYTQHPGTGEANLAMGLSASEAPRSFTPSGLLAHPFLSKRNTR